MTCCFSLKNGKNIFPFKGFHLKNIRRSSKFLLFSFFRCDEPNVVETYYDIRKFPIMYDNLTVTVIEEKILNHEEFDVIIRNDLIKVNKHSISSKFPQ